MVHLASQSTNRISSSLDRNRIACTIRHISQRSILTDTLVAPSTDGDEQQACTWMPFLFSATFWIHKNMQAIKLAVDEKVWLVVVGISYLTHVKDMKREAWKIFSEFKTQFLPCSIFTPSPPVNNEPVHSGALFVTDGFSVEMTCLSFNQHVQQTNEAV